MGISDGGFSDLRVLVLDDSRPFRQLLRTLLHQIGVRRIEMAGAPVEATARIGARSFDLLFVEQVVAGADGIAWLGSTRAAGALADRETAVVMIGSRPCRRRVEAAIDAGVDGFLIKPFSLDGLRRHLVAVFDRRRSGPAGDRSPFALRRLPPSAAASADGTAQGQGPRRCEPLLSVPGLDVGIRLAVDAAPEALFVD